MEINTKEYTGRDADLLEKVKIVVKLRELVLNLWEKNNQ